MQIRDNQKNFNGNHPNGCGTQKYNMELFMVMPKKPKYGWRSRSEAYHILYGMKKRCTDVNAINYQDYGGRGIMVCERWEKSLDNFMMDMGPRPSMDHSIDRIDNNLSYRPGNCRWGTNKDQANNRRNTPKIEIDGEIKTLKQWCEHFNTNYTTAYNRIHACGWEPSDALKLRRYIRPEAKRGQPSVENW